MSKGKFIRNFALVACVVISSASASLAQEKNKPSEDPSQKARNVKKEDTAKKIYGDWVNKYVAYIITPEEKDA